MRRPDANLSPQAQPWGRWTDDKNDAQDVRIDELATKVEALLRGDGGQATLIASLQSQIQRLQFELESLYDATGNTYPPGTEPPAPPAPDEPSVYQIGSDWSRTWGSSSYYTGTGSEYTNGTYLYQGQSPENKIGMFKFNVGPARGRTITAAAIFLQNISSAWSSTFVAQFGTHGYVDAPTVKPGRENAFDVGWARGEGKWVAVPDWALPGLSNGSIQGFTVGGAGPSDANSAWFMGNGQPSPPVLRLVYV